MAGPENMAESTGPGPEGGAAPSGVPNPSIEKSGIPANEIRANVVLTDAQHAEHLEKTQETLRARQLLPAPLTREQQDVLIEAHLEAAGEPGKDPNREAGIGNYTRGQLLRKERILRRIGPDGQPLYSKEQIDVLIQEGQVGVGVLPAAEFATFNPDDYSKDPRLRNIAGEIASSVRAGVSDEELFKRYLGRLERLVDGGLVTELALADQLRLNLELWRLEASGEIPLRTEDPLLTARDLERIRQEAAKEGGSMFSVARATYEHYCRKNSRRLSPDLQIKLQNRREEAKRELINFKAALEVEPAALQEQKDGRKINVIFRDFREAVFKFYKKFKAAKSNEIYGGDKDTVLRQARHGGDFEETMFDDSTVLKELEGDYGALLRYIYAGIAQEMDKEQHKRDIKDPLNPLAQPEFEEIKKRRARERRRDRKYETRSTHYGVIYEFSAENASELPDAVLDYTKDQIFALLKNPPEDIDKEVRKIEEESGRYLEQNRIRLIEEGLDIPETHPEFVRAKALAKAIPIVLGYEQILYKGGEESAPAYKLKAAADYAGIEDAIYLENSKSALQMHLISTYKDGLYWLGQRWDTEKPESEDYVSGEGATNDLRKEIAEEIIGYAATHELYLSDEMTRGLYLDANGDPILGEDGLPIGAYTYREGGNPDGRNLRYAFDDNIERLLLDPDGSIWADTERKLRERGESQDEINKARERHNVRVAVFQRIKDGHDIREGLSFVTFQEMADLKRQNGGRFPTDQQLAAVAKLKKDIMLGQLQRQGLSPEQAEVRLRQVMAEHRKEGIRVRIKNQMRQQTNLRYSAIAQLTRKAQLDLEDADAKEGSIGPLHDKILWKWVEDYNEYLIKIRQSRWYPSGWDRVRVNIDRPTKVLDRELSGDELMAMFELNPLTLKYPGQLSDEEKAEKNYKLDEARFGFQLARSYQVFHAVDTITGGMRTRLTDPITGKYIGKLPDNNDRNHPNWEVNKRLGLINDQGQVINPDRKIARVFDIVQTRLQIAIEEEEKVINQAKAERDLALASGDQARIVETRLNLRDIILNSQFVATHVLKELGLVEGKLPVWSLNFLDSTTMYVFTEALADYGVEVGEFVGAENEPGVLISHNSKKEFYEIMERGRRALKAEYDLAAVEFMEGRFPTKDDAGRPARSIYMDASDFGIDKDPQTIQERNRIVNIGAVRGNRRITETRFELSTSGGVIDYELVSTFGDLGFYPLPVWWGVTDIRSMHGYYKRRDEKEYHDHKYADVMDPVQHAKSQAAAYKARTALTGGNLDIAKATGGVTAGFLMEIFLKSTNISEVLQKHMNTAKNQEMSDTADYASFGHRWRKSGLPFAKFLQMDLNRNFTGLKGKTDWETLRQMTYYDFDKMPKEMANDLYFKTYEVMTYLMYYIQAEKEVVQNRIGNAPRNWQYDNTVKWYAFRRLLREAVRKGERGMVLRHKFSPEAASEISLRMIEIVLEDADYVILKYYERERLAREGAQLLSRALTNDQKKDGFIIPDEEDWANPNMVSPSLRKALENIRRRGLLEFMREEGYTLYETDNSGRLVMLTETQPKPIGKEVVGRKFPPLIQQLEVKKDINNKKAQEQYTRPIPS